MAAATIIVVLGVAVAARGDMCSYSVATGWGLCPAAAGETVCLPNGAPGESCSAQLRCLGVGPLCFDFTLAAQGGPATACPRGAVLATELKCTPMLGHRAMKNDAARADARPPS